MSKRRRLSHFLQRAFPYVRPPLRPRWKKCVDCNIERGIATRLCRPPPEVVSQRTQYSLLTKFPHLRNATSNDTRHIGKVASPKYRPVGSSTISRPTRILWILGSHCIRLYWTFGVGDIDYSVGGEFEGGKCCRIGSCEWNGHYLVGGNFRSANGTVTTL